MTLETLQKPVVLSVVILICSKTGVVRIKYAYEYFTILLTGYI